MNQITGIFTNINQVSLQPSNQIEVSVPCLNPEPTTREARGKDCRDFSELLRSELDDPRPLATKKAAGFSGFFLVGKGAGAGG